VAWVALAIVAVLKFEFIWLTLVGMFLCSLLFVGSLNLEGFVVGSFRGVSNRFDAFDNQYAGVFAVRQVRPGFKFGGICAGFRWLSKEYCRRSLKFVVPRW
jgi:hypothetical protein